MRICFLANGSTTHTYNWIQYFAKKGHQVHLISLEGYKFEPHENIIVHPVKAVFSRKNFFYYLTLSFRIRKILRTINPDILHAHYLTDYGLLGYLTHFPRFVITCWGSDILLEPKFFLMKRILVKPILNSAKLVTVDSVTVRDECLKYCNDSEKTKVILWGVDLTTFHEKTGGKREQAKITILSTRFFDSKYNIDTIVQSIPYVKEKFPDVKYVLKSINSNPGLQRIADDLKVSGFIEFVCKKMGDEDLSELHHAADIFISVPSSDSSSISLLEAMACGLPVIVSDIPANHEWVTDGWNGLIVPDRNPEKLAEAILQLIEKPDLRRLYGERNAQIIRERADREKHMAHMEDLYKQLLENT
jgi:L-malate glycosyltransferase